MATTHTAHPTQAADLPAIRQISQADLNWALAQGWQDFSAKRGDLIVVGLLYPLICFVAVIAALNAPLLPLLFPLVAGLTIAGPAAASGFYELARRRAAGLESSWWHFLDPLNGRSRMPIAVLTIGLGGLFVAWLIVAYLIYAATFGITAPMRIDDLFGRVFTTREGWEMILIGNAVGLVFAIVTLVFSIVSFPMVVDRPVDASVAAMTSYRAVSANKLVIASWGLRIVALLVLGLIPAAIGLAVVLPWLGYATWHLYTRLVVR
ncbi:MAG: hypothetical protein B7Y45_02530 [Sphingomonas sp. 28-66-16]|nr:MAG: hypothetical protein B7Y45_02530 [Sphingomonas sp. 28-66-16]